MVRESLRSVPAGQVDVTLPVTIDRLSYIDPNDPAMPMYRVIANNRQPVALRDLMIAPVRSGYIGDGHQPDPSLLPLTGAGAVPDVGYPLAAVVAGIHDPIVDSANAFAQRIRDAGGDTVDYFPAGMPHGFYFFPGGVHPEEAVAYDVVAKALAAPFGRKR